MAHIVRRVRQAGIYFVTSRTWQSRAIFRRAGAASILLDQILNCRDRGFYKLHEFVIMPDHFHLLFTPAMDTSLEKAVQMVKGGSARRLNEESDRNWPIWQAGFHDRWVRDKGEYDAKAEYIRMNPVIAKLADTPQGYSLSSACGNYAMDAPNFEGDASGAEAHSP